MTKEAGVDPSALRRTRFPELVSEIQEWVESNKGDQTQKSPRQIMLAQRSRNRGLKEKNHALEEQRDIAMGKLLDAQARIVELTLENQRLRAQLPESSIRFMPGLT